MNSAVRLVTCVGLLCLCLAGVADAVDPLRGRLLPLRHPWYRLRSQDDAGNGGQATATIRVHARTLEVFDAEANLLSLNDVTVQYLQNNDSSTEDSAISLRRFVQSARGHSLLPVNATLALFAGDTNATLPEDAISNTTVEVQQLFYNSQKGVLFVQAEGFRDWDPEYDEETEDVSAGSLRNVVLHFDDLADKFADDSSDNNSATRYAVRGWGDYWCHPDVGSCGWQRTDHSHPMYCSGNCGRLNNILGGGYGDKWWHDGSVNTVWSDQACCRVYAACKAFGGICHEGEAYGRLWVSANFNGINVQCDPCKQTFTC